MSAIVWYAKQVMDKVEARVQKNMDKAAILLQKEIVKSFGSPPSMPKGQLTPYGVRKLASQARKKAQRIAERARKYAVRAEKRRWRKYKKEQKAEMRQMKVQERRKKAMKREAAALVRAGKHEWGD